MTKEEKIKEAWAEYYNFVKVNLGKDGSFYVYNYQEKLMQWCLKNAKCIEHSMNSGATFIPYSIIGIEDNNNWNKISEAGHPKSEQYVEVFVGDEIYYDVLYRNGSYERCFGSSAGTYYENLTPTHWREIDERKPIY